MKREQFQELLDEHSLDWGTGQVSSLRMASLRKMLEMFGGNKAEARKAMKSGVWAPVPEKATDEEYVETAGKHACPVAYMLQQQPGRTNENTYLSYEKKDEAFRFLQTTAIKTKKRDLLEMLNSTEIRGKYQNTDSELSESMMFPRGVDSKELRGVAKLAVFDTCDFMKILDFAQHGDRPDLAESEQERWKYRITWEVFEECVLQAKDTYDLAARIAKRGTQEMLKRMVSEETINRILVEAFAKKGSLKETGQKREARKLINAVSKALNEDENLAEIASEFRTKGLEKIS